MRHRIMRAATRPTNKGPASNFGGTVLHEEVFAPEADGDPLPDGAGVGGDHVAVEERKGASLRPFIA